MRCSRFVLSAAVLVAISAWSADKALAQGRPGGFGFGGGFGGFQQDPISLLRSEGVRKELEIESDQAKQIDDLRREMDAEIAKSRQTVVATYQTKLDKLLQPQQVERLRQISLQLRGLTALTDAEVKTKVGISDEQVKQIENARAEGRKKIEALRGEGGGGGGGFNREAFEKMRTIQQETDKAVLAVLSEEQQKKFNDLKGKEIDRSQLFPGFGGGRQGGGGAKKRPDTE